MAITASIQQDFPIATFRGRSPKVGDLFLPMLNPYRTAGVIEIGSVALDGSHVQSSAGVHRAISYGRMRRQGQSKLVAEAVTQDDHVKATDPAETLDRGAGRRDQTPNPAASGKARSYSVLMDRLDVNLGDVAPRNDLLALRRARLGKPHNAGKRCCRRLGITARPSKLNSLATIARHVKRSLASRAAQTLLRRLANVRTE